MNHIRVPGPSTNQASIVSMFPSNMPPRLLDDYLFALAQQALPKHKVATVSSSLVINGQAQLQNILQYFCHKIDNPQIIIIPINLQSRYSLLVAFMSRQKLGYYDSLKQHPPPIISQIQSTYFRTFQFFDVKADFNNNNNSLDLANYHCLMLASQLIKYGRTFVVENFNLTLAAFNIMEDMKKLTLISATSNAGSSSTPSQELLRMPMPVPPRVIVSTLGSPRMPMPGQIQPQRFQPRPPISIQRPLSSTSRQPSQIDTMTQLQQFVDSAQQQGPAQRLSDLHQQPILATRETPAIPGTSYSGSMNPRKKSQHLQQMVPQLQGGENQQQGNQIQQMNFGNQPQQRLQMQPQRMNQAQQLQFCQPQGSNNFDNMFLRHQMLSAQQMQLQQQLQVQGTSQQSPPTRPVNNQRFNPYQRPTVPQVSPRQMVGNQQQVFGQGNQSMMPNPFEQPRQMGPRLPSYNEAFQNLQGPLQNQPLRPQGLNLTIPEMLPPNQQLPLSFQGQTQILEMQPPRRTSGPQVSRASRTPEALGLPSLQPTPPVLIPQTSEPNLGQNENVREVPTGSESPPELSIQEEPSEVTTAPEVIIEDEAPKDGFSEKVVIEADNITLLNLVTPVLMSFFKSKFPTLATFLDHYQEFQVATHIKFNRLTNASLIKQSEYSMNDFKTSLLKIKQEIKKLLENLPFYSDMLDDDKSKAVKVFGVSFSIFDRIVDTIMNSKMTGSQLKLPGNEYIDLDTVVFEQTPDNITLINCCRTVLKLIQDLKPHVLEISFIFYVLLMLAFNDEDCGYLTSGLLHSAKIELWLETRSLHGQDRLRIERSEDLREIFELINDTAKQLIIPNS